MRKSFMILLISIFLISIASAIPDPGHSAEEIGGGTFDSGNFAFQNNLSVGSTALFVNSNLGRVGIGTANPTNTLQVIGDANVSGTSYLGNVKILGNTLTVSDSSSEGRNIVISSNKTHGIISTSMVDMYIKPYYGQLKIVGNTDITGNLSIDTLDLFVNSNLGRVGIGTSTPTNTLNVVGDANITGTIYAHNFTGNSDITFINSTGGVIALFKESGGLNVTGDIVFSGIVSNNNLPRARGYKPASDQVIPADGDVTFNLTGETYDNTNNFNPSASLTANGFTAPIEGYYQVNGLCTYKDPTLNSIIECYAKDNGILFADAQTKVPNSPSYLSMHVSDIRYLHVGDLVQLGGYASVATTVFGSPEGRYTYLSIEYLNGAQLSYIGQNLTIADSLSVTNKVGVGTTSPDSTLDVHGNINSTGNLNAGSIGGWINYGASSTIHGFASYSYKKIYYKKLGDMVWVSFDIEGTGSGTVVDLTLPYNSSNTIDTFFSLGFTRDNGVIYPNGHNGECYLLQNSNFLSCAKTDGAWIDAANSRGIIGQFFYTVS